MSASFDGIMLPMKTSLKKPRTKRKRITKKRPAPLFVFMIKQAKGSVLCVLAGCPKQRKLL
jgi:hypothetical protein